MIGVPIGLARTVPYCKLLIYIDASHKCPEKLYAAEHRVYDFEQFHESNMAVSETILIVDDDDDILTAGRLLLRREFGEILTCRNPEELPRLLDEHDVDVTLLDMNFGPGESSGEQGLHWLGRILDIDPAAVVIMITAHGSLNTAVDAMKRGATDFVAKPWQNEKVVATVSTALKLRRSRRETESLRQANAALMEAAGSSDIVSESQQMEEVLGIVRRAAPTDANVLILGENGTGKELVAREIHRRSTRAGRTFLTIDMGSLSESVFESELFGHRKGAFTGADTDRTGRIQAANGGTLFLDEIGNLPLHLQAKLLSVTALTISCRLHATSWRSMRTNTVTRRARFPKRRSKPCSTTTGRETCAPYDTRSSARSFSPTATRWSPETCS